MEQTINNRPWYFRSLLIIPLLLFCFPIGVALMWRGKRYSIPVRSVLSVMFGLFWVVAITASSEEQQRANIEAKASNVPLVVEPAKIISREAQIENAVHEHADISESYHPQIEVKKLDSGGYRILVMLKPTNALVSRKFMASEAWIFYGNIFALKDLDDVEEVWLEINADMVDQYGQPSIQSVGRFIVNKALAKRVNWQHISPELLVNLLQNTFINAMSGKQSDEMGSVWFHDAIE